MKLRVVVADDNAAFLQRLVSLLGTEFEVLAAFENSQSVLEFVRSCHPDVVVLDLEMAPVSGIALTKELRKLGPNSGVVICSVESDPDIVEAARQAGALGYVFKRRMVRDLIAAVRAVAGGESFVSSR